MRFDYGYEEQRLDKHYDLNLLKKLYAFGKPYRGLFSWAILLVISITLLDLALPYVTKVVIDRYIVPRTSNHEENHKHEEKRTRFYRADISNPKVSDILKKYNITYNKEEVIALIPYEKLAEMDRGDVFILRAKDIRGVGLAAAVLLALVITGFFLDFFEIMLMEYTGQMVMHDLRMQLFNHIQDLSVSFFTRNPTGRLVTRVTSDVQNMHEFFTSVISVVFKDIFLLFGIMIVLIGINWKFALVSFTVMPFVVIASFSFSNRAREAFRTLRVKIAEINSRIAETIGGIKVIQLFRKEGENYEGFEKINHENYIAGMKQIHVLAIFMPVIELLGSVSVALVIFYGGGNVISSEVTIGALVAFISYMKMFFRPIRDIADKYNILQNAMSSAERIFLILDNEHTAGHNMHDYSPETIDKVLFYNKLFGKINSIEFKNVSFGYAPDEQVLNNITLYIRSGEKIAVVGPTGTGKTTLLNLLERFYDPESGVILVNGTDIREIPPALLRSKMALVMQDSFLFSGTVRENIARGKSGITDQEMEHIIDASNCRAIIERLPQGLDTVLSEGGRSISSGERQLISIARALARDPEIIMLDEATSYVDSDTESRIEKAVGNLMKGRTSIIIAHRLSTARRADRIIVLKKGKVIESGSHEELIRMKGFYYRLFSL